MYTHVSIEYANPSNLDDSIVLNFRLRDNTVAPKWVKKLQEAQSLNIQIDEPGRFYGFGSIEYQTEFALTKMQKIIDTINAYYPLIERELTDIHDQDTLNYLHHIFEVYHGLLNKPSEFFQKAPGQVQQALCDLNNAVHRCESITHGAQPRHIVTYYKSVRGFDTLDEEDYASFEDIHDFGVLCLNYIEIGKDIQCLTLDNDQYISDEAFKPFRHYSADFIVKFFGVPVFNASKNRLQVAKYYYQNQDFFMSRGLHRTHRLLKLGLPVLADIDNPPSNVLELLETRQYVKSVTLT